jgi:hypothetical protein
MRLAYHPRVVGGSLEDHDDGAGQALLEVPLEDLAVVRDEEQPLALVRRTLHPTNLIIRNSISVIKKH